MGVHPDFRGHVIGWVNRIREGSRSGQRTPVSSSRWNICCTDMRLYKSVAEISHEAAAKVASAAHRRARQVCKTGMWEYQVEAEFIMNSAVTVATMPTTRLSGGAPTVASALQREQYAAQ